MLAVTAKPDRPGARGPKRQGAGEPAGAAVPGRVFIAGGAVFISRGAPV